MPAPVIIVTGVSRGNGGDGLSAGERGRGEPVSE
jgi:hypothetical protein